MKLINQSVKIINQEDFSIVDIKKHIEKCAKLHYKLENDITNDSYEKFVDDLIKKDNERCLEFGTVHLKIPYSDFQGFMQALYSERIYNDIWIESNCNEEVVYVTTNYRYYLNMIKCIHFIKNYFTDENNEYYPKRYTVHFITNRATTDEFITHVGLSHLVESTEYVNLNKGKFRNELTFIRPYWCDIPIGKYELFEEDSTIDGLTIHHIDGKENPLINTSNATKAFLRNCDDAEMNYFECMNNGCTFQEARDVLPLSIKSELISCGFQDAWYTFFNYRCNEANNSFPNELSIKLKEKLFYNRNI